MLKDSLLKARQQFILMHKKLNKCGKWPAGPNVKLLDITRINVCPCTKRIRTYLLPDNRHTKFILSYITCLFAFLSCTLTLRPPVRSLHKQRQLRRTNILLQLFQTVSTEDDIMVTDQNPELCVPFQTHFLSKKRNSSIF